MTDRAEDAAAAAAATMEAAEAGLLGAALLIPLAGAFAGPAAAAWAKEGTCRTKTNKPCQRA
jgi:hypothetical protein